MRTTPTDEERGRYTENGYLVVEEFLDEDELEHWRTVGRRRPSAPWRAAILVCDQRS